LEDCDDHENVESFESLSRKNLTAIKVKYLFEGIDSKG
jgi:hypothetical protein